jgi:NAD(P)H-dependent flavin oxidoreductase YrpB (nitropropane dioxygenase family)
MGVAVSNWQLTRAVSLKGQMGVVSETAPDTVFIRCLLDGDTKRQVAYRCPAAVKNHFMPRVEIPKKPRGNLSL